MKNNYIYSWNPRVREAGFANTVIIALIVINVIVTACLCREIKLLKYETERLNNEVYLMDNSIVDLRKNVETLVEDDGRLPGDDVEAEWPKLYTTDDAIALAKLVYGEGRGVPAYGSVSTKCQQAAIMWVALNRYDAGYGDSIIDVITAPDQFYGYYESHPIDPELLDLAYDVLDRWNREKHDETMVGRVIPNDYYWFLGDGTYNHFRNDYDGSETWQWELVDPYV